MTEPIITGLEETHRVNLTGLPHQIDLWTDQDTPEIAMVGPLGCGKTYGLGIKQMLLRLANVGGDGILMVPTLGMAERIHKREWPDIWRSFGIVVGVEGYRNSFVWPWGARTWIISAEEPDRAKGINAADAMIDEPGQCVREAYDVLCSRVRNPRAAVKQVAAGGTPEGLNWFADLFANPDGKNRKTIWAREWHADLKDYYERIKQTYEYDEALLDTYGRGKFVPLRTGRAYKFFDAERHVSKVPLLYQPAAPLVLACDFNVDYMRWLIMQFTHAEIVVLDEIALGFNGTTELAALEFVKSKWAKWAQKRPIYVTGDASGSSRSTTATQTDYDVIFDVCRKAGLNVALHVPESNPAVKDRVALVNFLLSTRSRQVVRIADRCETLIRDFQRVGWKNGGTVLDQTTDPSLTHPTDAFGYAAEQFAAYVGVARARVGSKERVRQQELDNPARKQW